MEKHWRWNSNYSWHYFSSMKYEEAMALSARNDFMKYHHLRSCIFFSLACVETFLNVKMKEKMTRDKCSDEEVLEEIRRRRLQDKLKKWPKKISNKDVKIPLELKSVLAFYEDLRHEIVHVKPLDHSFYLKLDDINVNDVTDSVARLMVTIHSSLGEQFPYWLLGWNYVGLNGRLQPVELNNHNSFVYSLLNMGFTLSGAVTRDGWVKKFMSCMEGYEEIKIRLDDLGIDIEPANERFPMMPRITRKWWAYD